MNYNITNLIAAILLSVAIVFGWQHFFEKPRLQAQVANTKAYNEQMNLLKKNVQEDEKIKFVDRAEIVNSDQRIRINSNAVSGSIPLKGLRFDDLTLLRYKQELNENKNSNCINKKF